MPIGSLAAVAEQRQRDGRRVLVLARGQGQLPADAGEQPPEGLEPLGLVVLAEVLWPNVRDTIEFLRAEGVEVKVLSGDAALHDLERRALMIGPVLLCSDGSEAAADAIRGAAVLFPGREAIVLSVAVPAKDELPLDPMSDLVGRLTGLYRDWDEACAELAESHARSGCQLATEAGMQPRPLTAVGKAAATILHVADEHDVAVIVLGSGAHGALSGLLGSVATRIVHQAKRPVLVVPRPSKHR